MLQKFLKNTIIYGMAAMLPKAMNVLLVKLHTAVLGTAAYSVNTSFYVWAAYFNVFFTYGMETAFFRFFNKYPEKQNNIIATSFWSIFFTGFFTGFLLWIFSKELAFYLGFEKVLHFKMLVLITILDIWVVVPFAYLRALGRAKKYTLYRLFNIIIYAFFNVLFLLIFSKEQRIFLDFITEKTGFIFLSNVIASFFTLFLALKFFRCSFFLDFQILKKMLFYGIPVMIAGLAYVTNENLDKLVLERFLGKNTMGMYAGAYKIGVFMSLFVMAFRLGAEPLFFKMATQKNNKKTYALVLKWFVIVGVFGVLLLTGFMDFFANVLLGNTAYYGALSIVPIILFANLFLGIYNALSIWYKLTDATYYGMYISVLGAIFTGIFLWFLVPLVGFLAAAWTTFFVYFLMVIISYFLGQRKYKIPYPLKTLIFYLFLGGFLVAVSFLFFRGAHLINASFLFLYLAILFVKEKKNLKYFF